MLLTELDVWNFRNLRGKVACGTGLNILLGKNGQGKTNWLEAINFLATGASFRTARLAEAVAFGENEAVVRGLVRQSAGVSRELTALVSGNTKLLSVNGKRVQLPIYREELHSTVFNADSMEIIRGGPEYRRQFLDESITAIYPPFVSTLADYARIIRQKNALLHSAAEKGISEAEAAELLAPWNSQLIAIAGKIYRARQRIVERINAELTKRPFSSESLAIRYRSSLEGKGDIEDYETLLQERLALRLRAEIINGHSLIGPHRDDLEIDINGYDARRFASAGQQRTALLSLQIANIEIFRAQRGEYPLFLIDDLDAELDFERIGRLLDYLEGKTQTFITTSKVAVAEAFGPKAAIFKVEKGLALVSCTVTS